MSILNDGQIKHLIHLEKLIIDPFVNKQIKELNGKKCVSYGLSSFGYDFRLDRECYLVGSFIYRDDNNENQYIIRDEIKPIDVKAFDNNYCYKMDIESDDSGEYIIMPPHSFVLGKTVEYLKIPRDCLAICFCKSTYARVGIVLNTTPAEPLWESHLTLELSNTTPCPVKVYVNEGIGQLTIFQGNDCEVSYADRQGKYQNQVDVTFAKV